MFNLKEEARDAIYDSIKEIAKEFFERPYYFLYESDIHCTFFNYLLKRYRNTRDTISLKNNSNNLISNAIHSEPLMEGTEIKPDILIYHTDESVDVTIVDDRKFHFPSKSNQSRSIIEFKLNRSPSELRRHYRESFKNDLNKVNYYHADHFYFLFFDRSLKIDDPKYAKFVNYIKNKTMENKSIEVIYIGADIKNPDNGLIRRYGDGKFENI